MSYIKNMQAFGKLKGICTGLGGAYNPGQQHLQVEALDTIQFNAQQVMDEVIAVQIVFDNASNARETAFRDVRLLGSRICAVLRSSGADPLTLADAIATNRKLNGWKRHGTPLPRMEAEEAVATGRRRSSSTGFASQAYYFAKLVEIVTADPYYMPSEPELSKEGLATKVTELRALNDAVLTTGLALTRVKKRREAIFYEGKESLVETARAARNYVRGVFGFRSTPHEELTKVSLIKPAV